MRRLRKEIPRDHWKIKEKDEAANKELSQIKEKTAETKNSRTSRKRENRSGSKRHRWRVLRNRGGHRTANEEAGSIVLHVGYDMDERKKTAISNEEACREGEATLEYNREETNGKQTENMIETDCLGEELLEHCTRTDEEAGSIKLRVGHDMNEKEKNDEEADEAAAAKKSHESHEEISKEDVEIRRLIEERRTTPKEEKQRLKEVGKQKMMHQRQKKANRQDACRTRV